MFEPFPDSVLNALQEKTADVPRYLGDVLKVAFYSSLGVEEGRAITFTLAICSPEPHTPEFPGDWDIICFQTPRPFIVREVIKLAPAADPQRVLIGVHEAEGVLRIWGLLELEAIRSQLEDGRTKNRGGSELSLDRRFSRFTVRVAVSLAFIPGQSYWSSFGQVVFRLNQTQFCALAWWQID